MHRQHSSGWIVLFLTTLIGSTLLQAPPALGTAQTHPSTGMPPGIDVAIEQLAAASSEATGQPASNAVDGDATTHWCPGAGTDEAQLTVDLDRLQQLNGTGVTWVGHAPKRYKVQISVDGRHWRQLSGRRSSGSSWASSRPRPSNEAWRGFPSGLWTFSAASPKGRPLSCRQRLSVWNSTNFCGAPSRRALPIST